MISRSLCRRALKYYSTRLYSSQDFIYNPQRFAQSQTILKQKDGLSGNWELIYRAPMEKSITLIANFISGSTVLIAGGAAYYLLKNDTSNGPIVLGGSDVIIANNFTEFSVYILTFIALHISMKVLISRYVLRMYRRDSDYMAVFQGSFLNSINKHSFKSGEVSKLKPTLFVSWRDSRYSLGQKKGILLSNYFKSPAHLNEITRTK